MAEIIDNDQGALGGNTFVDVQKIKGTIHVVMGKFSKLPTRIYTGRWGEYETMDMRWNDEHTLILNGKEYKID